MEKILEELNKNPMFRLSLGSKELFHSNFLAFLWDQNPKAFLELLNDLCHNSIQVEDLFRKEPTLDREKENFDICIHHKEGKGEKEIYDIIIENKVKSIPYKEQLEDYENKVKQHQDNNTTTYILLTLADNFPNANNIKGWTIVSYKTLAEKLESKKNDFSSSNQQILQYIEDYIHFIEQLTPLKDKILEDLKNNGPYHQQEDINTFHKYKLSDLYIKLRGAYFIGLIKDKLESTYKKNGVDVEYFTSSKFEERRRGGNGEKTMIWLHSGMNRGKSTVTASINPANSEHLYELQIEGDQYRHMFNQNGLIAKRLIVSNKLLKIPYFDNNKLPNRVKNSWAGERDFNQYKPNCLYKYVKFNPETTVNEMIEILIDDIVKVLRYIRNCESVVCKF